MLTIEEYIAKRKKEDKLNEFSIENRIENIKLCVDYVFEYFNTYLDITEADHQTILNNERLERFRHQVRDYDKEIQDWLVSIYDEYGKHMHKNIGNILEEDDIFLLYNTESEFRSASYECYSRLKKKFPFLKEQTEMLFLFIKEYHRVKSNYYNDFTDMPVLTQSISEWQEKTLAKFQVNIYAFTYAYIYKFCNAYEKWPLTHKKKSDNAYLPYDYNYKQKKNLFNLDSIYQKASKKPFIRGRKQELELLMMYHWLHTIETDDEYWEEYLAKMLPVINK